MVRITVSLDDAAAALLVQRAGSGRKQGAFLSALLLQEEAAQTGAAAPAGLDQELGRVLAWLTQLTQQVSATAIVTADLSARLLALEQLARGE